MWIKSEAAKRLITNIETGAYISVKDSRVHASHEEAVFEVRSFRPGTGSYVSLYSGPREGAEEYFDKLLMRLQNSVGVWK